MNDDMSSNDDFEEIDNESIALLEAHKTTIPVIESEIEMDASEKGFDELPDEEPIEVEVPKELPLNDVSKFIKHLFGSMDTAFEELMKYNLTKEKLNEIKDDPDNVITKIAMALNSPTDKTKYGMGRLIKMIEEGSPDYVVANQFKNIKDKLSSGEKFDTPVVLEGDSAIINTTARLERIKKINLDHSGFWISIRKFSNDELRNLLTFIDEDKKQMGKLLGNYYYLFDNVLFVEAIKDLLPYIVTDSNLKNFRQGSNLAKAVKLSDYETILNAMLGLMYKDGIYHELICPMKNCNYVEKELIDLNELKLIDNKKFPLKALEMLMSPLEFTLRRSKEYEELIKNKRTLKLTDDLILHLKVPTLFTFVKHGKYFLAKMMKSIYAEDGSFDENEVSYYKRINYFKMFTPWIEKIEFLKPDGSTDFSTSEFGAILKVLENDAWEENPSKGKELRTFFSDCKFVHFAYLGKECPSCKNSPDVSTNGLVAVDIEDFFFILSGHKLTKLRAA